MKAWLHLRQHRGSGFSVPRFRFSVKGNLRVRVQVGAFGLALEELT